MSKQIKKLKKSIKSSAILKLAARAAKSKVGKSLVNTGMSAMGITSSQRKSIAGAYRTGTALFGDKSKASRSNVSVPAASNTVTSNSTYSEVLGKVTSQFAGSTAQGIRIRGCQPFTRILAPGAAGRVMASDVATTVLDGLDNVVLVNPVALGGPLLTQASNYSMFVVREFKLEYITLSSSIQVGEFAICYVREPTPAAVASGGVPTTFGEAREVTPSATLPYRSERVFFQFNYDGQQLYYVQDSDPVNEADDRLTHQGQIRAYAAAVDSGYTVGYFQLHYIVDLFYPTINSIGAFAATHLRGLSKDELKAISVYANKLRADRKDRGPVPRLRLPNPWDLIDPVAPTPKENDRENRTRSVERSQVRFSDLTVTSAR